MSLRLVVAVALAYSFGALSVTADEIFWLKIDQGTESLYYFPILGAWKVWAAWDLVFAGMGLTFCLLCLVLSPLRIRQMNRPRFSPDPVDSEIPKTNPFQPTITQPIQQKAVTVDRKLVEVPGTGIYERST